jgi:hypothetical protein
MCAHALSAPKFHEILALDAAMPPDMIHSPADPGLPSSDPGVNVAHFRPCLRLSGEFHS